MNHYQNFRSNKKKRVAGGLSRKPFGMVLLVHLLIAGSVLFHPGLIPPARAGENKALTDILTLYWENDVFAQTDRDYTNGLKLTWSSDLTSAETASRPVSRLGNALIRPVAFGSMTPN